MLIKSKTELIDFFRAKMACPFFAVPETLKHVCHFLYLSMMRHMQIFLSGSHSAADMALLFIDIQYLSDLTGQCGIDLHHSVGTVLMYCALAYTKSSGCLPYRCLVFNDIMCYFNRPFFNVILQVKPPKTLFLQCMQRWVRSMQITFLFPSGIKERFTSTRSAGQSSIKFYYNLSIVFAY